MKSLGRMKGEPLATAGDSYLPGSGNRGYRVSHYALDLDYRVASNRLSGTASISAVATDRLDRFSLDLSGLTAAKIWVNGIKATRFIQTTNKLTVTPASPLEQDAHFDVKVKYSGVPFPRKTPWGDVGWEELTEGVLVAGQPSGAPSWFPCNDHPSNMATFHLEITTESQYRVVSTGQLVSTTVKSSRTRWVFETREPMATYLATVQIGSYKPHLLSATPIRQVAYIPEDLDEETAKDFAGQPAMMQLFEKLFGPYPFHDYTVVVTDDDLEIPLEAHGLSVFGRNHVDGRQGSNRLIAHELAHSWFGNSLTLSAWKDIWLHEGFACYAEWIWSEACGGPSTHRLAQQNWALVNVLPQDFNLGDPGPLLMFDDRVYKRGALTLHALRLTLGDETFFAMLRSWTHAHRHGSVSTEAFLLHASAHSPLPVRALLQRWLFGHVLPRLPRGLK